MSIRSVVALSFVTSLVLASPTLARCRVDEPFCPPPRATKTVSAPEPVSNVAVGFGLLVASVLRRLTKSH